MRALSSGTVFAAHVLFEGAFVYNVLLLAARSMNENDAITDIQQLCDNIADLIYAYHLFIYILTVVVDGGFRRDKASRATEWSKRKIYILLHIVANLDFSWLDRDIIDSLPISLRIFRIAVVPIVSQNLIGVEDITLEIVKNCVWQLGLILAAWAFCYHPDMQILETTPVTIMSIYFTVLFFMSIVRKKPPDSGPQATDKEKEESEGGSKDLETVCRVSYQLPFLIKHQFIFLYVSLRCGFCVVFAK